jgi:hypothetical protein
VTVPANVVLAFLRGGSLSAASSYTVTMNGPIDAGQWQIFGANILLNGAPKNHEFNLRWWGGAADNVTDDSAVFSRAFAAMNSLTALYTPTLVIPPGLYALASTPTALTKGLHIRGSNYDTVLKPITSVRAIQINDVQVTIEHIYFFGNASASGTGVYIDQQSVNKSVIVSNCRFGNLEHGIYLFGNAASQVAHQGAILHGLEMKNCVYGIYVATRAEYVNVIACDINTCNWAIYDVAGNLHVTGCNLSDNGIGIELVAGDNDAHGAVVGCAINHCSSYGIKAGNLGAKSHKFVGCDIIASNLLFTLTRGLLIQGCQLTTTSYYFDGADGVTFKDCIVDNPLLAKISPAVNGNQSYFNFIGCRDLDGKTVQGFYAFNGGVVFFTPSVSQTAANNAATKMQFTVASQGTPFNAGQTKYTLTSGSPLDTFVNHGLGNGWLSITLNMRLVNNVSVTDWAKAWVIIKVGGRMVAAVPTQLVKTASDTYPFFIWSGVVRASAGDNVTMELNNYTGQTLTLAGNGGWECSVEGL